MASKMEVVLYFAASLTIFIGIVHSYLGERYILRPLFRLHNLPHLFGGTEFTIRTIRFAWHVTSIAWWGLASILILLAHPPITSQNVGLVIGATFLLHFFIALIGSRGKYVSWIVFLAIGVATLYATQSWSF